MGIGLNLVTSAEAASWVQNSAFQMISECGVKAVGRPAFIMSDTKSDFKARKYSAIRETFLQLFSMGAFFLGIIPVQKLGFKFLKNRTKLKDFKVLENIHSFEEFSHVFGAFTKGKIETTAQEALELQKAKGSLELIKICGSIGILTILCPLLATKLVLPTMQFLGLAEKKSETDDSKTESKSKLENVKA